MLIPRIIPCLDVRDGRVVKGVRFQNLRDAGDPVQLAAEYERQGADELVMLDVSATPDGRRTALETVAAIRSVLSIPLTVGGGVRSTHDAAALLEAGADKVGVNTAAVKEPALLSELARRFGSQCVVLAIDAIRRAPTEGSQGGVLPPAWDVVVRSGTDRRAMDAVEWGIRATQLGAGEVLLTSVDRDGVGVGYDLELVAAMSSAVEVPVIASGGASTAEHLAQGLAHGAEAVLAASIFHDGVTTVSRVKEQLRSMGIRARSHEQAGEHAGRSCKP
ncbi:MAG TPA: imidazole glycerol phosphate synthase subunit HisF [Phycisphaerales bacterium]|nr:imidazole glycerol phosphate synthase subunit HisF [Phycisphaerales bacterium]